MNLAYLKSINEYKYLFLNDIKQKRYNLKYSSPVKYRSIPIKKNIIPNAWRPYRAKYTHWIHQWWDIFSSRWTPVVALADWLIVRVKNDFKWEDFDRILWKDLTDDDRLKNLDIYRWNQVWLKTVDWNITFYAHLSWAIEVNKWQMVKRWDILWYVDRSWVPDKEYKDFHLHFEIQLNDRKSSSPTQAAIMKWPYFWKWLSQDEVISKQYTIFNSNEIAIK